jgi:HlyD family secretion protein
MKRIATAVVILAAIAAAAWALWPKPINVQVEVARLRDITLTVEAEGQSRIRDVFTISAPVAGQIQRINLHAGDAITAGSTVVARIVPARSTLLDARSREIAIANRDAARAAVNLAAAQLQQAEAKMAFAQTEFTRAQQLVRRGTISERAYEQARLDLAEARANVKSMAAQLMVRNGELQSAEAVLLQEPIGGSDCCVEIKAPVSGTILKVRTESEQVVSAGTPLVDVGDPNDLEIMTDVLSQDAAQIAPGAAATIIDWGGPPLKARVRKVEPAAITKVSALGIEEQRVPVILDFIEVAPNMAFPGHGYRVTVRIKVWEGQQLLALPIASLVRRGSNWTVFVAQEGRASERSLSVGVMNDDVAEITEGIAQGEKVILHPPDILTDGGRVSEIAPP